MTNDAFPSVSSIDVLDPPPSCAASKSSAASAFVQSDDNIFWSLFEAAPYGNLIVDTDRIIQMVNPAVLKIFGYTEKQLVGKPIETLVPFEIREEHPRYFQQFLNNPSRRSLGIGRDLTGVHKNGGKIPVEVGLVPLRGNGGLRILATVIDISERKRVEELLQSQNAEMQQLMYVVSHDLKSPLVTIEGFATLLGKYLGEGNLEKAGNAAGRIVRSIKVMGHLIQEILELSRVGSREIQLEAVSTDDVVDEVLSVLGASIAAQQAAVQIETPLPEVFADRNQLLQLYLNLVQNGLKYGCPEPGNSLYLGGKEMPHETHIYVRDEGPGIDPRFHSSVFHLFKRLTNDNQGTGVGLATVAKVVERHNGRVWIESQLGKGAAFWVAFPKPPTKLEG